MGQALKDDENGRGCEGPKCLESTRHHLLQSRFLQLRFISRTQKSPDTPGSSEGNTEGPGTASNWAGGTMLAL